MFESTSKMILHERGLSLGGQAAATELRQNEPGRISPGAGLQGQRAERWPD